MMKRKGITIFRWAALMVSFIFLLYGANFMGSKINWVKLPVFSCALSPSGGVDSICKTIVDVEEWFLGINMIPSLIGIGVFLLLIILFGRLFCGYVCPFGFVQELLSSVRKKLRLPSFKIPLKVKPYFTTVKWIMVIGFLLGIGYCDLCPVRYVMLPLAGMVSGSDFIGIFLAALILGLAFFNERIFCRICPIGALAGIFNSRSLARIKKKGVACTHCRACLEVCPMEIKEIYEEREKTDLTKQECIYCMKCIEICPEETALSFELCKKNILVSKRHRR